MFGSVSLACVLVAYTVSLQHGSCTNISTFIRMCQAACRNVIGKKPSQAGFLFIRCKLSARTGERSSSDTTDKTTTAQCLHGREFSTGRDVTIAKHKSNASHRSMGVTLGPEPSIKESSLFILPELGNNCGYRMNLANTTVKQFYVPTMLFKLVAVVYIRNEQRFLFSDRYKIRSFKLNAHADSVIVRKISGVKFMRYDNDKQLVFLSRHVTKRNQISRMRAGGGKYRLVMELQPDICILIALDTKRAFIYFAAYQDEGQRFVFRINYDGEERKTVVKESFSIEALTIDAELNIVYYIARDRLMKVTTNGHCSVILKLKNKLFLFIHQFEFQSNVLYMSVNSSVTSLFGIALTRKPVLKSYRVGSIKETWVLCLV